MLDGLKDAIRTRLPRAWRWILLVMPLIALTLLVTLTFGWPPFQGSNLSKARAETKHLFTLLKVPPGSVRIGKPSDPTLDGPAAGSLSSDHFIDVVQYWRFPLSESDASMWVQTHPPQGLRFSAGVGASASPRSIYKGFVYSGQNTNTFIDPSLHILIGSGGTTGSNVRVDATLVWLSSTLVRDTASGPRIRVTMQRGCPRSLGAARDVRNPTDGLDRRMLPTDEPTGGLICSYRNNGMSSLPPQLLKTKTLPLQEAAGLARTINEIRLNYPGRWSFFSCKTGTTIEDRYILVFSYTHHPDVDLLFDDSGCGDLYNGYLAARFENGLGLFPSVFDRVTR